MAKMENKLVSGTINLYVFIIVNGKQIVCTISAPGTMKQIVGTKKQRRSLGSRFP